MNNQIIILLKKRMEEISAYEKADAETQRNILKEELQFYILNFIYHHSKYSNWIMYGGSAVRICHGLNRMSIDLDFEISDLITKVFLNGLKKDIENYFKDTYGVGSDFLTTGITNNRGLTLKFHIGEEFGLVFHSNQVHVKIDLNHFVATKSVIERIPINRDQLSFVIKTYNMSALMASKIAAIFLRGKRGVGNILYEEKGRDIYDLLWYMNKRILPDINYLMEKDIEFTNPKNLFDAITKKILNNEKTDDNLRQDLTPLFLDHIFIENWIENWRGSYLQSLKEYKINTITTLKKISLHQNPGAEIFSFVYYYNTDDENIVKITYDMSGSWIDFNTGNLPIKITEKTENLEYGGDGLGSNEDILRQYSELFYQKTERHLEKVNRIIFGDSITTRLIRMTANNLNPKEQVLLTKSALLSSELVDLLK